MPARVQFLPEADFRVETGVLQVGEDWPGYFMRGDFAIPMAAVISRLLSGEANTGDFLLHEHIQRLVDLAADMARAHEDPARATLLAANVRAAGDSFLKRLQAEGKL